MLRLIILYFVEKEFRHRLCGMWLFISHCVLNRKSNSMQMIRDEVTFVLCFYCCFVVAGCAAVTHTTQENFTGCLKRTV